VWERERERRRPLGKGDNGTCQFIFTVRLQEFMLSPFVCPGDQLRTFPDGTAGTQRRGIELTLGAALLPCWMELSFLQLPLPFLSNQPTNSICSVTVINK